jgi:hypothetical protein
MRSTLASMLPRAGLFFSGLLGALGDVRIITFVAIYFAAQPYTYIDGIVTLVPKRKRARAREVLDEIGTTLSKWLFGKACSMLVVGAATALGLWLLGVPLALILGIIAGLLDFIPYLGPLMAGVPAVLMALYTIGLFAAIQLAEGYLLQPLVEQKTVNLPPGADDHDAGHAGHHLRAGRGSAGDADDGGARGAGQHALRAGRAGRPGQDPQRKIAASQLGVVLARKTELQTARAVPRRAPRYRPRASPGRGHA